MGASKVRFVEGRDGTLSVLEFDLRRAHPMLDQLSRMLRGLGVQVVHSERRLGRRRCVVRLFVSELDGERINRERRAQLQAAILAQLSRASEPKPAPRIRPHPDSSIELA